MEAWAISGAQIGQFSYAMVLAANLALCAYLRPAALRWSMPEVRVWIACLTTAIWAGACFWQARHDLFTVTGLHFFDAVQSAAWLSVLAAIARAQNLGAGWRISLVVVPIAVVLIAAAGSILSMSAGADPIVGSWVSLLVLVQPLLGIMAIEQIYRNATGSAQPSLRWLLFGVGAMLITHLFMFAAEVATKSFDWTIWNARGVVFLLAALAIYKGLHALGDNWQIGLFVSRQVVFYSTSSVLIGAYLVLMSIGGELLRTSAGTWGIAVQVVFMAAAGAILLVLIFSGAIRRRLMAFLSTHFFRNRYDYRIEWLRFVKTLSARSAQENLQQNAIRAMCQIVESDAGSLWLCDENATRFLHAADWPTPGDPASVLGIARSDPLLAFMQRCGWVVDLQEMARSPQLYDNAEAPAGLRVLGDDAIIVPLLHVESMYGVMVIRRPPGRDTLHFEDRDLLKTVGRHLAAHLWQADIDRRLANSKQFEAYNHLTAFVMHDLKNLTAQLQLVVSNAAKHKRNPEFVDDAIATIANSVDRMGKLLAQLAQDARTGSTRSVSLADVAQRVALRAGTRQPTPTLKVNADVRVAADPEQLSMVLDHVVRNAQDATEEKGDVLIEIDVDDGAPRLRVSDTGQGMDDVFIRDRLFRPFDTTKGARGMGIGAYQVREYLRSLGGEVLVNSAPGRGTTFTLVFPHV